MTWEESAFLKLARLGAIVLLPTEGGKFLLQDEGDHIRPPGGHRETTDKNLTRTIVRELGEEFALRARDIKKKLQFIGYEYRQPYLGNAVFMMVNHGLKPGEYQASNSPDEKVVLVEAKLSDPRYTGPNPDKLQVETDENDPAKQARFVTYQELKDIGADPDHPMAKGTDSKEITATLPVVRAFLARLPLRERMEGHGKWYGSCGHILYQCRCSHGPDQVYRTKDKCKKCWEHWQKKAEFNPSYDDVYDKFKPDLTPEEIDHKAQAQDRLYHKMKPRLASMAAWPKRWIHGDDSKGWLEWYKQFDGGRRTSHDAKQIQRWRSFKARTGAQFRRAPSPRRAWALTNWGIDPLPMLPEPQREGFKAEMEKYRSTVDSSVKNASADEDDEIMEDLCRLFPEDDFIKAAENIPLPIDKYHSGQGDDITDALSEDPDAKPVEELSPGFSGEENHLAGDNGAEPIAQSDPNAEKQNGRPGAGGLFTIGEVRERARQECIKMTGNPNPTEDEVHAWADDYFGQQALAQGTDFTGKSGSKKIDYAARLRQLRIRRGEDPDTGKPLIEEPCYEETSKHTQTGTKHSHAPDRPGSGSAGHDDGQAAGGRPGGTSQEGQRLTKGSSTKESPVNETSPVSNIPGPYQGRRRDHGGWSLLHTGAGGAAGLNGPSPTPGPDTDLGPNGDPDLLRSGEGAGADSGGSAKAGPPGLSGHPDNAGPSTGGAVDEADPLRTQDPAGGAAQGADTGAAGGLDSVRRSDGLSGGPPLTGPDAIHFALQNLDLGRLEADAKSIVQRKLKSKRPDAVKVLGYLEGMKKMGIEPHELMLSKVPVIPPNFRPYSVAGDTFVPGDANELYRDLINLLGVHEDLTGKLGPQGAAFNHLNIYDAMRGLYGFGEPTSPKTKERGVSGFLKKVTGHNPKFCHDDATEILTRKHGWVFFKDLPEDTEVSAINPVTGAFEWQQPTAYSHSHYEGEMVELKVGYRVDALVTPSHRMWLKRRTAKEQQVTGVDMEKGWDIELAAEMRLGHGRAWLQTAGRSWEGKALLPDWVKDAEAFAELAGWWVAEGWIPGGKGYSADLCQSDTANSEACQRIDSLVRQLELPFSFHPYPGKWTWSIQSKQLAGWLKDNFGEGAGTKFISREVLDWPAVLLSSFLRGYLGGDGSKRLHQIGRTGHTHKLRNPFTDNHAGFVTTSRCLFDGLVEVGAKLGLTIYRRKDYPQLRKPGHAEQFVGSVIGRWNLTCDSKRSKKFVWYKGGVHCCSVPNGLLLTRRNGKLLVSGNSFFQHKMLAKDMDYVGRGVIGVDPDLGLDEIGVPEEVLWKLYSPYLQRNLVRSGMSAEEALKAIKDQADPAKRALDLEIKSRPVVYSRAPSWHKFNVIAGYPKRTTGNMIRINPLVTTGLNADFDGDTMNIHLPSMPDSVKDAKEKLMPSKMLFSVKDRNKVMPVPKQEMLLGLWQAQNRKPSGTYTFPSEAAALSAIKRGEVRLSDEIVIGQPTAAAI